MWFVHPVCYAPHDLILSEKLLAHTGKLRTLPSEDAEEGRF